jgi:hypothetical protein
MMNLDTPKDAVRNGQPCCMIGVLFVATASATILALSAAYPASSFPRFSATSRAVFAGVTDAARRLPDNPPPVTTRAASATAVPPAKLAACSYIAKYAPDQAEYVSDLLYRHFGKDALLWAIIVRRESGYNLTARNRSTHCYGLFQLHPCHRRALERAGGDWHSVEDQAAWAAQMYRSQGTRPWAVAGAAKRELSKLGE